METLPGIFPRPSCSLVCVLPFCEGLNHSHCPFWDNTHPECQWGQSLARSQRLHKHQSASPVEVLQPKKKAALITDSAMVFLCYCWLLFVVRERVAEQPRRKNSSFPWCRRWGPAACWASHSLRWWCNQRWRRRCPSGPRSWRPGRWSPSPPCPRWRTSRLPGAPDGKKKWWGCCRVRDLTARAEVANL